MELERGTGENVGALMPSIADRLAERYRSARVEISVPDMGDVFPGGVVYAKPMTVAGLKRLEAQEDITGPESSVDVLISLAEDEDGRPIFGQGDRHAILEYFDAVILRRIVDRMISVEEEP